MPGFEPGVAESGSMNANHCAKITYCTKLGQQLSPSHKQCLLSFSAARVCSSLSHKPLNEYVRAIFVTKNSLISGIRSQVLRATLKEWRLWPLNHSSITETYLKRPQEPSSRKVHLEIFSSSKRATFYLLLISGFDRTSSEKKFAWSCKNVGGRPRTARDR